MKATIDFKAKIIEIENDITLKEINEIIDKVSTKEDKDKWIIRPKYYNNIINPPSISRTQPWVEPYTQPQIRYETSLKNN